jgi:hypothetical protein
MGKRKRLHREAVRRGEEPGHADQERTAMLMRLVEDYGPQIVAEEMAKLDEEGLLKL